MKKIKQIVALPLCFILSFLIAIFPSWLFAKFLVELEILTDKMGIYIAFAISIFLSIFILILIAIAIYNKKRTKIINWFSQNYARMFLFYIVACITLVSLKTEIIFKYDGLKEFISIQWSIIGLAITIFLVWNVLIIKHLKQHKPKKSDTCFPIETFQYISEKKEFYMDATQRFNSISLLIINLILLIITTLTTYVSFTKVNLFNQNLAIASFYFSTNTLIAFFFDILLPLREDKKDILKDMKVTVSEIRLQNRISEEVDNIITAFEKIDNDKSINSEEKELSKRRLLYKFSGDSDLLKEEEILKLWEKD